MFVVIVGGGKVGRHLAWLLHADGYEVRLVEQQADLYSRLAVLLPNGAVIMGDGADPQVLQAASIHLADVVAAVTGSDETNVVVATLARFEFGVRRVIGRVNNPHNAWLYTPEMGVDVALNQADLMAKLIVEQMSLGDMMTLLKLRKGEFSLVEEKVAPVAIAVGKRIRELALPSGCLLVAIMRDGLTIAPNGDTQLQAGDEVLAVVRSSEAEKLAGILGRGNR